MILIHRLLARLKCWAYGCEIMAYRQLGLILFQAKCMRCERHYLGNSDLQSLIPDRSPDATARRFQLGQARFKELDDG